MLEEVRAGLRSRAGWWALNIVHAARWYASVAIRPTDGLGAALPPAEEAFSVYDHPRVVIFHKSKDFSPEKATEVLAQYDLSQVVRLWPKQATAAPTALMLDQDVWHAQQGSGTWSEIYNRDSPLNRFPVLAIVAVWLLVAVMGTLAWPVIAFAWPALPDRGWGLARTMGLLIVAYLAWLAASLRVLTFARGTLLAATLTLAILGALIAASATPVTCVVLAPI